MIMILAESESQNILHFVQGPESELSYTVHGSITINISALLAQMNGDKPVLLSFTKCDSESEKAAHLSMMASRGSVYPFQAQTFVFGPKAKLEAAVAQAEESRQEKEADKTVVTGTCTRCGGSESSGLVPNLTPAICYACAAIDLGLAKTKVKKATAEKK